MCEFSVNHDLPDFFLRGILVTVPSARKTCKQIIGINKRKRVIHLINRGRGYRGHFP